MLADDLAAAAMAAIADRGGTTQAGGQPGVTRKPPDPDRNRSITRTSPSTANGTVPGAVSW